MSSEDRMSALSALARPDAPERKHPAAPSRRHLALVPDPARRSVPQPAPTSGAAVIELLPPPDFGQAAPLRLTRRGVAVVGFAVAALAATVLALAARSAPAPARVDGPARVSVHPGDTLWAVATRVAPQVDPRAEVAVLQRLNHLTDPVLRPGEVLRIR
jgi:hypothetical protein